MIHKGTQTIKTPRLTLRPFTVNDAEDMYNNWAKDSDVTKFLTWQPHKNVQESRELLSIWEEDLKQKSTYIWCIVLNDLQQAIGSISVVNLKEELPEISIGYCIGNAFWSQGIVSEALLAVITFFFRNTDVCRLSATHDVNNPASGQVMKKCGLHYEGILHQAGINNTGIHDSVVYALTRKNWVQVQKYPYVFFDMDGTLLNTLDDLTNSVNYALTQSGYPNRTLEEIRSFIGNGVKVLLHRSIPEHISEEAELSCLAIFQEHYKVHYQDKTRPYEGLFELMQYLKSVDVKIAVITNKIESHAKELCEQFFPNLVDICIGNLPERLPKPAPDGIYDAIKQLGASPSQVLYVGDTEVDLETAKNANIPCIAVTWGFRTREELRNYGAKYIIDQPEQLQVFI